MLYPFRFKPILKERIWGSRRLQELYGKELPQGAIIGESWEISDRPGDESEILNGSLKGRTIHHLVTDYQTDLLGNAKPRDGRFPLLIKILDAQDKLSLQVHPPSNKAAELKGDSKTEMWYVAAATPEADIFAGLKKSATRKEFEEKLGGVALAECFHRIPVKKGDAMFMPSGRVHALGAGSVIFEVQENSDTTYRVFDWGRVDASGKPRQLHIKESLASIDFQDFEPALVKANSSTDGNFQKSVLVNDPLFRVEHRRLASEAVMPPGQMVILGVLDGNLNISSPTEKFTLKAGEFSLVPAKAGVVTLSGASEFLWITAGGK